KAKIDHVTGITANDRTYDTTTNASLNTGSATFNGLLNGDSLTVGSAQGQFADKNAGIGKTVNINGITLSGADAANYEL
ncbi:YDG domain-containing protein, partial [Acinetobacter wuhouensis]